MSSIVNVADLVISFPQSSAKVKVTVSEVEEPHRKFNPVLSLVSVALPQSTLPETLDNQLLNSSVGFETASHCKVKFEGSLVHVGPTKEIRKSVPL